MVMLNGWHTNGQSLSICTSFHHPTKLGALCGMLKQYWKRHERSKRSLTVARAPNSLYNQHTWAANSQCLFVG